MPTQKPPKIPIPKGWPSHVKSDICRIIQLAPRVSVGELSTRLCVFRQCFPSTQRGFTNLSLLLLLSRHSAQLSR